MLFDFHFKKLFDLTKPVVSIRVKVYKERHISGSIRYASSAAF